MKMACGDRGRVPRRHPRSRADRQRAAGGDGHDGIDAISHAVETDVTTRRTPMSQMFSQRGVAAARPTASSGCSPTRPTWKRAATMQLGAHLAGIAIENSMLGAAHACANPLTARSGLTHGVAIGILFPHVVRFNAAGGGRPLRRPARVRPAAARATPRCPGTWPALEDFARRRRPAGLG